MNNSSSLEREIKRFKDMNNYLFKKYYFSPDIYNKTIISNILYNQKYHIVSLFKEILIYDDPGEFFKRYYNLNESYSKIKTYCEFYEKNSKIFPNYISLPESKIIFKNIKKKQKMLNNINEDNKKENNEKNNEQIFSNTIMNSILSENSSLSASNEKSVRKLIKKISNFENKISLKNKKELESFNLENQSQYIFLNSSKIDFNISKVHSIQTTNKHHYKKFIKEIKLNNKLIKSGNKKVNEKKISKQNLSGLNNVYPLKKKIEKTNNIIKNVNKKMDNSKIIKNKLRISNNKIEDKSKSRSKNKDYLSERTNKSKIYNTNNSIQKKTEVKKLIKKPLTNINNKKNTVKENKENKKEAKSMPKLMTSLNKSTGINNIQHKPLFSANNKKYYKCTNNNNCNYIKSSLKFSNIKLQKKHSSNFKIEFHNGPVNNYIEKHIPSLHISLNNNIKNISRLSKSKSKSNSKSKSKSKSKSPNSTSNSLNKKFRNQNNINSFNNNFKYNNNIRTLIHKDILFSSDEGLQTERLKYKNTENKISNPIKSISINKNKKKNINNHKNTNNNISNNNIVKRNNHKKIISVTPSIEYTKIIPKTAREIKSNYISSISGSVINNNKLSKDNVNLGNKLFDSLESKNKIYGDSHKSVNSPPNKKNLNDKNYSNNSKKNYNKCNKGFVNSRRCSMNKSNNLYHSHNYTHHPVKKIQTFDNQNKVNKITSPKKKNK